MGQRETQHQSQGDLSAPQNRPALVSLLSETLGRLREHCVPPRQLVKSELLWFKSDEMDLVNTVWRTEGLQAVYQRWKGERSREGAVGDVRSAPNLETDSQSAVEEKTHHLLVLFYKYDPIQPSDVTDYYRYARFNLPPELQNEIKTAFLGTDILGALESGKIRTSKSYLSDTTQRDLSCHVETFGEANPIEQGTRLSFGLDVLCEEGPTTRIILSVKQDASVSGLLWSESACEIGYEGHEHFTYKPSDRELRVILPVLAKICEQPQEYPKDILVGTWQYRPLL